MLVVIRGGGVRLQEMLYSLETWPLQVRMVDGIRQAAVEIAGVARAAHKGAWGGDAPTFHTAYGHASEVARDLNAGIRPKETVGVGLRARFDAGVVDCLEDLMSRLQLTRSVDWRQI